MTHESLARMSERSSLTVALEDNHEAVKWHAAWKVTKYETPVTDMLRLVTADELAQMSAEAQLRLLTSRGLKPYEVIEREGNLAMYGGVSALWESLIGNGTGTASQALTFFNNANAAIGVGDSSTAAAATQTDLQAVTNKLRKAMDATYPVHTDGVVSGAASIQFQSTFATTDANWVWNEWGVFNSATAATGRMLNRKVAALGTKTSAASWQFLVTLTLA